MSFAESVAWAEKIKDPNNGHTWTLVGSKSGALVVACINDNCRTYMTTASLLRPCTSPNETYERPGPLL